MNTKKALNLIIVLLLIINIFLLFFIISFDSETSYSDEEISYVRNIMEYRGIIINVPFTNKANLVKTMIYKEGIFTQEYVEQLSEMIDGKIQKSNDNTTLSITFTGYNDETQIIQDRYEADKKIRIFLDTINFNNINYLVDNVIMTGTSTYHVDYIYISKGDVLYDLYISAIIDEYGMKSIKIKYIENILNEDEIVSILPVSTILMSQITYRENVKGGNIISRIDSGYKQDTTGKVYYCYRITDGNQQVRYFNGIYGREIN